MRAQLSTAMDEAEAITSLEFQQLLLCSANSAVCPMKTSFESEEFGKFAMTDYWVRPSAEG